MWQVFPRFRKPRNLELSVGIALVNEVESAFANAKRSRGGEVLILQLGKTMSRPSDGLRWEGDVLA